MADQKLRVDIIGDASKLNRSLTGASEKLKSFGSQISSIGKKLSVGLTLPIGLAGGAAIKLASDFQESLNKVDVAFGESSKDVRDFAKTTLKQFGIARGSALDMAALFGDMSTSMGLSRSEAAELSTSLVGLAGDLASFKNMNIAEVTTALNGVFTGETESLKRLGIVMTQVNLEQFALNQGITKSIKEMTQAEKVNLRFQFVMSKTANAHGDFARTQEGAANQMREFQESLKELGVEIGLIMLPIFTKLVEFANRVIEKFKTFDEKTKTTIIIIAGIAAAVGPVLILIGSMASGIGVLSSGIGLVIPKLIKFTDAIKTLNFAMVANPVGIMATAVALLTAGLVELLHRIEPAVSRLQTFFNLIASLGNPLKFAELQAKSLADAMKEKSDAAKVATKEQEELRKVIEKAATSTQPLVKEIKNVADAYEENLAPAIDNTKQILDNFLGTSQQTAEDTKNLITFDPDSVQVLEDDPIDDDMLKNLLKKKQSIENALKELNENATAIIKDGIVDLGVGLGEAIGMAISGTGDFVQSMGVMILSTIGNVATQLGTLAIKIGVGLKAIRVALKSLNPAVAIAAGVALVAVGALFKAGASKIAENNSSVPSFATGGIVSAPTLALVGDNFGAGRGNPEVIAPLDKLKSMIGQQTQTVNVGGEFRVEGQDLVLAIQRAEKNRNRLL